MRTIDHGACPSALVTIATTSSAESIVRRVTRRAILAGSPCVRASRRLSSPGQSASALAEHGGRDRWEVARVDGPALRGWGVSLIGMALCVRRQRYLGQSRFQGTTVAIHRGDPSSNCTDAGHRRDPQSMSIPRSVSWRGPTRDSTPRWPRQDGRCPPASSATMKPRSRTCGRSTEGQHTSLTISWPTVNQTRPPSMAVPTASLVLLVQVGGRPGAPGA